MNKSLILIIILFSFNLYGQETDSCFFSRSKSEFNFRFCLDQNMSIKFSEEQVFIYQKKKQDSISLSYESLISLKYNYKNETAEEIWRNNFGQDYLNSPNLISYQDSILTIDGNEFYVINLSLKDKKKGVYNLSNAIGIYHTQYYFFQTLGANKFSSLPFLMDLIQRSTFFGEPYLIDEIKQTEEIFEQILFSNGDISVLDSISLTSELILKSTPQRRVERVKKEIAQIKPMLDQWNLTNSNFIQDIKAFESLKIVNIDLPVRIIEDEFIMYQGNAVIECDSNLNKYEIILMQVGKKLYLGSIVKK